MKLFFAASIRGGGSYGPWYREILEFLTAFGEVVSEHHDKDAAIIAAAETGDEAIFSRDTGWIGQADLLVAEVSQPSIGVGYEIGFAESRGIPVFALYHLGSPHPLSAMIAGNRAITTICYETPDELRILLQERLSRLTV